VHKNTLISVRDTGGGRMSAQGRWAEWGYQDRGCKGVS